jgi:hypothetical protein
MTNEKGYLPFLVDTSNRRTQNCLSMIRTATTFVIGAGASKSYGLPTGRELRDNACDFKPNSDLYGLVQRFRCSLIN